jgi:hypothetical protein
VFLTQFVTKIIKQRNQLFFLIKRHRKESAK